MTTEELPWNGLRTQKYEVFTGILILLIISEKEIYSKIQKKKEGKEAGKKDIGHKKLKKKRYKKERRIKQEN
jgi:hypothetical protein